MKTGQEYLEIELDENTLPEIKTVAHEEETTPFEMCVKLLREAVSAQVSTAEGRG